MKLKDFLYFNPKENLKKGTIAKKVPMERLLPFTRKIDGFEYSNFSGGTKFRNGDTLLARITPCLENGKTVMVSILDDGEVAFGSTEYIVLREKEGISDKNFIYYLATSPCFRKIAIKSMIGTSGRQRVQQDVLKNADFNLPPIEEQRKIAGILGALDDKIELNEKINQNLEAQAQAIFKSWFVDFEPFKNGKFVDSELGKIPEGWRIGTFSELIIDVIGGDWGKDEIQDKYTEEVYCVRGADIPDVKIGKKGKIPKRYILSKNYKSKKLKSGDLVVEISGGSPSQSTGRIAAVSDYLLNKYDGKIICTNFCRALTPNAHYSEFIYRYWQYLYDKNVFFSYENGTTGIKNLDLMGFLDSEQIIIPNENVAKEFSQICSIFLKQVYFNGIESEKLSQLRDTLLPKLMSGEIDVSEVAV